MKAGKSIQVVIVGAGMGGLGTAITLRKAGHKVIVLEQSPEFSEACNRPPILTCMYSCSTLGSNSYMLPNRLERVFRFLQMPLES